MVRTVYPFASSILFLSFSFTHLPPPPGYLATIVHPSHSKYAFLDRGPHFLNFLLITLDWHESRGNTSARINDDVHVRSLLLSAA